MPCQGHRESHLGGRTKRCSGCWVIAVAAEMVVMVMVLMVVMILTVCALQLPPQRSCTNMLRRHPPENIRGLSLCPSNIVFSNRTNSVRTQRQQQQQQQRRRRRRRRRRHLENHITRPRMLRFQFRDGVIPNPYERNLKPLIKMYHLHLTQGIGQPR